MQNSVAVPMGGEPTSAEEIAPRWHLRRYRLAAVALAAVVFVATTAAGLLLRNRTHGELVITFLTLGLLMTAALLALAGAIYHHLHEWRRPLQRMETALAEVREGVAPIEELPVITGPLANLNEQIREMLREMRRQRAELSAAQRDLRQRIAQRTDALERLIASLRQQAARDPLTGLMNRRMLDQHLETVLEQTVEAGSDLCLLILDVDYFKSLNDTLGHAAGDAFLRSVGQIIRSTVREQDLVFRYGGDEFVVILPDAGHGAGESLARRLVSLVDALGKTFKLPQPPGLSVGMASHSEAPAATATALLELADKRLYGTKYIRKRGRQKTPAA